MGSSYTAAMAQKRSINSAGRRQCHFKLLKMALSSTSQVNRLFLSHKLIFFGGLLRRLAAMPRTRGHATHDHQKLYEYVHFP